MLLNCFDASFRSFEQRVLPELNRRGIAAIGMKSLGGDGRSVKAKAVKAQEAIRRMQGGGDEAATRSYAVELVARAPAEPGDRAGLSSNDRTPKAGAVAASRVEGV
jgi:hypothetical protein